MRNSGFAGTGRGLCVAVFGLSLALLRCGSSDDPGTGTGAGAGGTAAGGGHAGSDTAGAPHAGSGAAGSSTAGGNTAGGTSGGAAGASEAGAGGDHDIGAGGDDIGAGGALVEVTLSYVFNAQKLPSNATTFALDLDGNALPDNAYQNLVTSLEALGFPEQTVADAEIAAGRGLQLAQVTVKDSNLVQSMGSTLDLLRALVHANPDFGGTGQFTVDGAALTATLPGAIASSLVKNTAVKVGEKPQKVLLRLPFAVAIDVPVSVFSVAAHVAKDGLTVGQLNGAVSATDMDALVPPALAAAVNATCGVTTPPVSCVGVMAELDTNNDKTVTADEVRASAVLKSLLASDVKLFDAQGKYAPSATAVTKDAFSVGIGFTAVKAIIAQ